MSDATCRVNDATEAVEWLDVKAAAIRLNISERSVQRRASAGDLPSQMDGRRLLVCVPTLADVVNEAADSDATEPETSRQDASSGESVATSALMEQLQSENAWLRAQVETHQQNEAELRRLMLSDKHELTELRQKVALLAAPSVEDAAQDAQEARSAKVETNAGISAQRPRRWWEVWRS